MTYKCSDDMCFETNQPTEIQCRTLTKWTTTTTKSSTPTAEQRAPPKTASRLHTVNGNLRHTCPDGEGHLEAAKNGSGKKPQGRGWKGSAYCRLRARGGRRGGVVRRVPHPLLAELKPLMDLIGGLLASTSPATVAREVRRSEWALLLDSYEGEKLGRKPAGALARRPPSPRALSPAGSRSLSSSG